MDLNELRNLDFQTIGLTSLGTRLVIFAFVFVLIVGAVIYFDTLPQKELLEREQREEQSLLQTVDQKQRLAANLEAYQAQIKEMETRFGELLRQLPNKREAENLIDNVAQTSLSNGLKNEQIRPGSEVKHDFYAEMTYHLSLRGTYRELTQFVSDTANLPRIVTLHNPAMKPRDANAMDDDAERELTMGIQAKTYRYLESGEQGGGQ
ncbi:type 4a pilus biogenesis protein PilO [Guyparkeria hydrothermalis]|uniref:Type 4a pilus biogenesis protein PilO n=1 Tax=Guyparkeria halophila TaxID=47960 RepID=A0A6I6D386_9GAMM|nr:MULTISPECIES: type 4a pilus biogenesis protein PilO [Guyparkeria]MCL7751846.1 type 4a pilus biogenesis protein PilO [Guyparkeria hydrothermalis]QGT77791.1 type 4a pilus biogenesis protein PilO [Guyparkeria halophila]